MLGDLHYYRALIPLNTNTNKDFNFSVILTRSFLQCYKVPIVLNRTESGTFLLFITYLTFIIPSKALRFSDRSSQSLASCSDLQAHIKFTAEQYVHQKALSFESVLVFSGCIFLFCLSQHCTIGWYSIWKSASRWSLGKGKLSKYYLPDTNTHFKENSWRPCMTFPSSGLLFSSPLHQS